MSCTLARDIRPGMIFRYNAPHFDEDEFEEIRLVIGITMNADDIVRMTTLSHCTNETRVRVFDYSYDVNDELFESPWTRLL
jgi:hypothetical protein